MSDTKITPDERARWLSEAQPKNIDYYEPIDFELDKRIRNLIGALEQAESRAEKAEADNAALEEDLEATEKNLKETSGFIEELLSGLKHRFPVQYADLEGNEYGDDAFSSHDLFELVIDPAVDAAKEQAEAENAMLREERDWLAENIADRPCAYDSCPFGLHRPTGPDDDDCDKTHIQCWAEAASRAVAAGKRGEAMPEVMPCPNPRCGSTDCECLVCTINADESQTIHFHMACNKCFTSGPIADDAESAKKLWDSIPRALAWTNEQPKVAGKYWWRPSGKKIGRIRDMFVRSGEVGFLDHNDRFIKDTGDGEWAGPIPAPID